LTGHRLVPLVVRRQAQKELSRNLQNLKEQLEKRRRARTTGPRRDLERE